MQGKRRRGQPSGRARGAAGRAAARRPEVCAAVPELRASRRTARVTSTTFAGPVPSATGRRIPRNPPFVLHRAPACGATGWPIPRNPPLGLHRTPPRCALRTLKQRMFPLRSPGPACRAQVFACVSLFGSGFPRCSRVSKQWFYHSLANETSQLLFFPVFCVFTNKQTNKSASKLIIIGTSTEIDDCTKKQKTTILQINSQPTVLVSMQVS